MGIFKEKEAGARRSGAEVGFGASSGSAAADIGHLGGHDGHELHVGVKGQLGHVQNRTCHMGHVHNRFDGDRAVEEALASSPATDPEVFPGERI